MPDPTLSPSKRYRKESISLKPSWLGVGGRNLDISDTSPALSATYFTDSATSLQISVESM